MTQRIRKAVFPVAGLGTRFLPATKAMPKEMLPVVDKPLIQYAVEEARAAGIEEFIFIVGPGKKAIKAHFDPAEKLCDYLAERGKLDEIAAVSAWLPDRIAFRMQPTPRGLGHAVWCARDLVGAEPFAVLLVDDLILTNGRSCLEQMVDAYDGGNMVAMMDVAPGETDRYGIADIATDDGFLVALKGLVEKPDPATAPSTLAVIGRYILQPSVFGHLSKHRAGSGGEIQLTDAMAAMIGEAPFHGVRFEGERFDCGTKIGFLLANVAFGMARDDLRDDLAAYIKGL